MVGNHALAAARRLRSALRCRIGLLLHALGPLLEPVRPTLTLRAVMTLLAIMPVRVAALLAAVTLSVAVVRLAMLMLLALARTTIIEALPLVRPGLHIVAARE